MAALTYTQMQARVALNLGNLTSSDPFFATIGAYINDASNRLILMAIAKTGPNVELFPELRKKWPLLSVVGTATIALPADALAVQELYSFDAAASPNLNTANRTPIGWCSPSTYELLPKAATNVGWPRLWTQEGSSLYLHPTPRTTYATYVLAKGIQKEPDLSAGSDTLAMDMRWHSAVVDLASYLMAIDKGWDDEAQRFMAACGAKITSCLSLLGLRLVNMQTVVRDSVNG